MLQTRYLANYQKIPITVAVVCDAPKKNVPLAYLEYDTEKIESPLTGDGFPSPPLYIINPPALIQGRTLELSTQRPDLILKICFIYPKPVTSDKALCKG